MDTLPYHCRENAITLKQNEYMNFEMVSNGVKSGLKFDKVPNFYIIDNKEYYAAEVKIEGLKVGTATLAVENMLNIKLHSSDDLLYVRNLNFLIPADANARKVSVEIFNDTIFMRAPLKKKHMQNA
ncbi:uncharacterized protein LOC143374119 [Andrena cerasifolii]|uniref:uncharacterized protein LOC143374119 n=1 Tax=Andrena cerasifolii TaxID=2819439 RepID=UPI0040380126